VESDKPTLGSAGRELSPTSLRVFHGTPDQRPKNAGVHRFVDEINDFASFLPGHRFYFAMLGFLLKC